MGRPASAEPATTLDKLVGSWSVVQLQRGHRFSTDDVVTAWRARAAVPEARRLLDLGSGIGSVGLSTLYHLPADATLVAVEAQDISVGLFRRTLTHNGLEARVTSIHSDLRAEGLLEGHQFELITGSPPYVPVGKGLISSNTQRAHARIELRGSIFDYCRTARRLLAPQGRFCFVMAASDPRTEAAPVEHGLTVVERTDVVFRGGRPAHIATLVCAREEDAAELDRVERELVIRDEAGEWTEDYHQFRREMGIEV
ncbi:MAG: methyltransferase [Alphaproteobacteria bacterium]|nr:methyltransferase [Alphaproteobacteria bacterium]MCB9696543.1 methyltransferase [Alphaproteobacteria bacterium]